MDENKRWVVLAQSRTRVTQVRLFGPYGYVQADQVRADLEVGRFGALYVFHMRRLNEPERTDEILLSLLRPPTPTDAPRAPRRLSDAMADFHVPDGP